MPKWLKGEPLRDPVDAIKEIMFTGMIFHNHKAQSSSWMRNWNIRTIEVEARAGRLFQALPNSEIESQ